MAPEKQTKVSFTKEIAFLGPILHVSVGIQKSKESK